MEHRQKLRSQTVERTQLEDPTQEWTETDAPSLQYAGMRAAESRASGVSRQHQGLKVLSINLQTK